MIATTTKMTEQQIMMYSSFHSLIVSLLSEQMIDEYFYNSQKEKCIGEVEAMLMKEKFMPFVTFLKEQAYINAEYEMCKYADAISAPNNAPSKYEALLNDTRYANTVHKVVY